MILGNCSFGQLPSAMQMHVLYCEKVPVSEYRLAVWSEKDTLYYNGLKESEVKRFVTLIESGKRYLNSRTMDSMNISRLGSHQYSFEIRQCMSEIHLPLPCGMILKVGLPCQ